MLAPFWTDLDGTGAAGVFIATLTDGVDDLDRPRVAREPLRDDQPAGLPGLDRRNGTEDITFAYDPANLPGRPRVGSG